MIRYISNLDFWGMITSFICAIHCALLPILLSLGIIGQQTIFNDFIFELSMLSFTVLFVYFSIIRGYLKGHVPLQILSTSIIGLILVLFHGILPHTFAVIAVVSGGLLISLAHLRRLQA